MLDPQIMDRCIQYALKNPIQSRGQTSISRMAAILTDGRMEYVGVNQYKTHPLMFKFSKNHNKISLHAEIDAILKKVSRDGSFEDNELCWLDIYVARVLKDGTPALAKPCETCMGALMYYGIRNIYWTGQ